MGLGLPKCVRKSAEIRTVVGQRTYVSTIGDEGQIVGEQPECIEDWSYCVAIIYFGDRVADAQNWPCE